MLFMQGLIHAVSTLAPLAEHRNCARHVYANWKKQHKGITLKNMFWNAVRATYVEQYKLAIEDIKSEKPAAYEDFIERGPQKFCKAFLNTFPRCDMVDNNISETFNGYIINARGKHVIDMLEDIRCSLMERQYKKIVEIEALHDRLCPKVRKKLDKLKAQSRFCIPHPALGGFFEVDMFDDKFVVSVEGKTCTCRAWDLSGIPCVHAISAFYFLKQDPAEVVHDYFTIERYKKAYEFGIAPLNGEKLWPNAEGWVVKAPKCRRMPGRQRVKRKRDADERDSTNPNKLRRFGLKMTCQKCFQKGHNKVRCQNAPVEKPKKEKGRRGRPPKTTNEMNRNSQASSATTITTEACSNPTFDRRALAKERALANKGIGVLQTESGNIYVKSSSRKSVKAINPTTWKPPRTKSPATQESTN
ncbi:uncharacterized protein LOC130986841 [Salvia miltiorrhiza]|uniref:uncharacterized protein LOC130986841 n=1 Tax=Salvia miltiorrhiza TaxID=226208 RepID=UPI0025AC5D10|nr:uncharacterized protein LOC130986841 [Salvia miltiorrhiza]